MRNTKTFRGCVNKIELFADIQDRGILYSTFQMRQFQWFSKILLPFVLKILEHFVRKKKSMTSAGTFSSWFMSHTISLSTSVVCKKNNVDLPSCWLLLYRIFCQYGCLLGQQVFFILYVIRWRPREQLVELLYLWLRAAPKL